MEEAVSFVVSVVRIEAKCFFTLSSFVNKM